MIQKKNGLKAILCIIMSAAMLTTLCGCFQSDPPAIDEVCDIYKGLIEGSLEINTILFGEGLETHKRGGEFAENNGVYMDVPDGYYAYEFVTEDSKYQNEDEIKDKAREIYSTDYIEPILTSCFTGFMDEEGGTAVQPKYLAYKGKLMLNTEYQAFIHSQRTYDYTTMQIVKPSNGKIVNVSIASTLDGAPLNVTLTFVLQNNQWRLDSPTY